MRRLFIQWQRQTDAEGKTCPRCASTGDSVEAAAAILETALPPLRIEVRTERRELTREEFAAEPLASNRIRLNGKTLEDWLGAATGHSPCCDQCGDAECRTLEFDGVRFEAVPMHPILKAGRLAAAALMDEPFEEAPP